MNSDTFSAMAFYHPHGLVPAWTQAMQFAGEGGRIATLPDIIDARLSDGRRDTSWSFYFTTATAEFYGLSKTGVPVVAVAHGFGPLSTIEGCLNTYTKDKDGNRRNGYVPMGTFHKLLDGHWGPVDVVDWERYSTLRAPRYFESMTAEEAAEDEWVRARLGGEARTAAYLAKHRKLAEEDREQNESHIYTHGPLKILDCRDDSNVSYMDFRELPPTPQRGRYVSEGLALAHLLSIGQLVHMSGSGMGGGSVLHSEISSHQWTDGTRFAGVRGECSRIHRGLDMDKAFMKQRDLLWCKNETPPGFETVIRLGNEPFTSYPKAGDGGDTAEPMCAVTSITKVGSPVRFETKAGGYYGFFKYAVAEVRRIAPPEANAYELVGDVWTDGKVQAVDIQFLKIEVDSSRRLLRTDQIYRNGNLVLELASAQAA